MPAGRALLRLRLCHFWEKHSKCANRRWPGGEARLQPWKQPGFGVSAEHWRVGAYASAPVHNQRSRVETYRP